MRTERRLRWIALSAVLMVAIVQALVVWRYRAPPPLDAGAPEDVFSAGRARAALERVLGDGAPHPVGSENNRKVRERIVTELRALGLEPELQEAVSCSKYGTCAEPINVIARIQGKTEGAPVLLAAHYDSVPAGAGAGDDGAGVATLIEVARVLGRAPSEKPVLLLFSDGEELGLLGAEAYAKRTDMPRPSAVLNVEARGTSGPSLLFETVGGSARFAKLASAALERPVTTSLSAAVYRRMPNDTDLTVFSRSGISGANFGFIAGAVDYHTPRDSLAELDTASLQHHGDNVLALTRALSAETSPPEGDAVWFDVLALDVWWWPMRASFPILFGAMALFAAAGALGARQLRVRGRDVLAALVTPLAIIALAGALGLVFDLILSRFGSLPAPWIAKPWPLLAGGWATAIASVFVASLVAGRAPAAEAHWATLWFWWLLLGAALTAKLPEASYLALVPTVVAALLAVVHTLARQKLGAVVVFVPLAVVLVLWLPIVHLLYDAIGFYTFAVYPIAIAMALSPVTPVIGRLANRDKLIVAGVALAAAASSLVIVNRLPAFSPEVPQRVTFALHHDADKKTSRWLADGGFSSPPPHVLSAGGFAAHPITANPWLGSLYDRVHAAPATVKPLPPPALDDFWTKTTGPDKTLRALFRSKRGAELLSLQLRNNVTAEVRFRGVEATPRVVGSWNVYIWCGPAADGVELEVRLKNAHSADALLVDHAYGMPPEGAFLIEARGDTGVSSQLGDVSVASRYMRL